MLTYQHFLVNAMSGDKVLFIINQFSGSGYRKELEGKIIAACEERSLECQIEFTMKAGHGTSLAKDAVDKGFNYVFAVGGDGTVNEVANGLLNSSVPLGIIPKGSGNGLARHLQIPLRIEKALKLLDEPRVISMDTCMVNGKLSINVSGIGFDGSVAQQFGRNGKRGLLSYIKIVITNFVNFNEFRFDMSIDGKQTTDNAIIISIANSTQFGNNAVIAPAASVCDQKLDISIVKKMSVIQGLRFVAQLFSKKIHRSPSIKLLKGSFIHIKLKEEQPFHIDGEAAGLSSEFSIKVNPASLRVIIPHGNLRV